MKGSDLFAPLDDFVNRHLGPTEEQAHEMLGTLGFESLDDLVTAVIPEAILSDKPLALGGIKGEHETLAELRTISRHNQVCRSYIGMGYYNTLTPSVIRRNILENPGWYTQYTPYQAEIAQGRLEALMNFQTMVADLTALPLANASLLDEGTAAAEAMSMCLAVTRQKRNTFFVAADCHPQTITVVQTRCQPLGIDVIVGDPGDLDLEDSDIFGVLVQYPTTDGRVEDYADLAEKVHAADALLVVATDLLALTQLRPPGEFGADIAVGSSQRFGVPLGFGGPHAAFVAARKKYERSHPWTDCGPVQGCRGRTRLPVVPADPGAAHPA